MKHAALAVGLLVAVACGSPPGPVAPPAAPARPAPVTSEYLDLLRAIDAVEPTLDREKFVRKAAFDKRARSSYRVSKAVALGADRRDLAPPP